jgi:membrane fusion protein (multidrug efflux system)
MPNLRDASVIRPVRAYPVQRALALLAANATAFLLVACGKTDGQAAAPAPQMPPVEVGVVTATLGDVGLVTELPGRVEASRVAEVRARAAGILQQRLFKEGSDVKAKQPLFRIDPAPYAATAESARAILAKAEANLAQARAQVDRYRPLVIANAISKQDFVNAEAAEKQAQAEVAAAKASVRTADINLGYASVTSPISGRIGRALVTEGALVGQGEATTLAVVQQIDPVYVNFTQSASDVFQLRRAMESGQFKRAANGEAASVKLVMGDGTEYATSGKLLFTDLSVDATTGQVMLRAEVPNPKGELLPGLYVRVRIEQAQAQNAISVPQRAVTRSETGDTLTVVGSDGKLEKRNVKITAGQNNQWIVTDGLKAGEQVMVDGFQKLQMLPPGMPVKAVPWTPPGVPSAAAAPSPSVAAKP